jgi:hypothetical protein
MFSRTIKDYHSTHSVMTCLIYPPEDWQSLSTFTQSKFDLRSFDSPFFERHMEIARQGTLITILQKSSMERKNERYQVRAVSQVHCERVIRCTFVPVWMNVIPKGNEQVHIVIGILSIGLFEIYVTRKTYEARQ